MSAAAIETVTDERLEQKALSLPEQAREIIIRDQSTFELACERLKGVAALRKEIVDHYAPLKDAAHVAHKKICDAERAMLAPVTEAESIYKSGVGAYQQKIEAERAEAERRAREAAELAHAEAIEAAATAAEQDGASIEEVSAIISTPFIAPIVAPAMQRVSGVSTAGVWKAQVTDVKALCAAIGRGDLPTHYVAPNMTALNSLARAQRESLAVPGVRAVRDVNVRVGGR